MPDDTSTIRSSAALSQGTPKRTTTPADLDRMLHDWQSRFTGGRSPSTVSLAFLDWAAHAANAPFQTAALGQTAMEQWRRFARAAMGGAPAITAEAADHRFANPAWAHAAPDHALEQLAQQIAVTETAVAVLGEGGVVGHIAIQAQAAEPAVGQVEMNLLAQPPLGPDAQAVAHQQHPDHQLRIDRGPTDQAVERRQVGPHTFQVHESVYRTEQVILGYVPIQGKLIEQLALIDLPLAHHARALPPLQE